MPALGRHVYGLAAIALGAVGLAWGDFAAVWQPFPDGVAGRIFCAYAVAALFLIGGVMLQWRRAAALGALLTGALCAAFALLWLTMRLVAHPEAYVMYNGVAEELAMAMGGLAAFASVSSAAWAARLAMVARVALGVCCLVFGGAHLVYVTETAAMVPSYMPLGGALWAQITGAAHIAAGLALVSGFFAAPAARLLTLMFIAFGALVWAPMLFSAPSEHMSWAGNAINFLLIGAAWAMADTIAQRAKA